MVVVKDHQQREPSISDITTVGLDLAKKLHLERPINIQGLLALERVRLAH
jgi:hypothetical protein